MPNIDMVVSVRLSADDLRKLRLIAKIYEDTVGAHIRQAVRKHIKEISQNKDFKEKAKAVQEDYAKTLAQLFKGTET